MLEFVAGALLGRLWLNEYHHVPAWVSCARAHCRDRHCLVLRDSPPLGIFNPMVGATLVVFGALNASFAAWQNRPLKALGDSSYSLYLTHLFTLGVLRVLWTRVAHGTTTSFNATIFILCCLIAASVVGFLVFRWIETPILMRLQHRGQLRRATTTAAR